MRITAEVAAVLAILTEALDDPGTDIAQSLYRLSLDAAAVPSYLGLSVVVSQRNSPLTVTVLAGRPAGMDRGQVLTASYPVLVEMPTKVDDAGNTAVHSLSTPGGYHPLRLARNAGGPAGTVPGSLPAIR